MQESRETPQIKKEEEQTPKANKPKEELIKNTNPAMKATTIKNKEQKQNLAENDSDVRNNTEIKKPSPKNEPENDIDDDDFEAKLLAQHENQKGKLNILQESRETSQRKKKE